MRISKDEDNNYIRKIKQPITTNKLGKYDNMENRIDNKLYLET